MPEESLILNPGRLKILITLARGGTQEFVELRSGTRLTDGNLMTHTRRLVTAGLVRAEGATRGGRSVTRFSLTDQGRSHLQRHADELQTALRAVPLVPAEPALEDDWID